MSCFQGVYTDGFCCTRNTIARGYSAIETIVANHWLGCLKEGGAGTMSRFVEMRSWNHCKEVRPSKRAYDHECVHIYLHAL